MRLCTTSSAAINSGMAINSRTCSSTSRTNDNATLSPQTCPSTADNSSSGAQASVASTMMRRRSSCSVSPARRAPRMS